MSSLEVANNLSGVAALVNGLVLWPIVRAMQKAIEELKADRKQHDKETQK
jgi:hypothetical protein